jgi:hypothetical protein
MSFIEGEITVEFGGTVGPAGPAGNAVPIAAGTVLANPSGVLANPVGVDAAGMRTLIGAQPYDETLLSLANLATPASTSLLAMNSSGAVVDGTSAKTRPLADATTPGIIVMQDADVATIMQSFEPARFGDTIGTDPVIGRWNWAINTPVDFGGSGTRGNRICGFGYNISKHGGGSPTAQELAGDASFGTAFEDFYDVAGTQRLFEWYIQTVPAGAEPGANQLRPLMVIASYPTLASNTTPQSGVSIVVDETIGFTVDVKHAGGTDTWQWGEATSGGLDTQCLVSAGSGIVFANNSRSIKALNSAGRPRDLMWMRSDNVVVISQGDPVYIPTLVILDEKTVSYGASDSAGAGFRVLRVPN